MNYLITKYLKYFKYLVDSLEIEEMNVENERETIEELFKSVSFSN
jgi:hypothetical protein